MKNDRKRDTGQPVAPHLELLRHTDAVTLLTATEEWCDRAVERETIDSVTARHPLWHNCLFRNVVFAGCRLTGAQLSDIRFEGCDLSNVNFSNAALNRVAFVGCKLLGTLLPDATLNDVRMDRCNARYLNLSGGRGRRLLFSACDLTEAVITDCRYDNLTVEACSLHGTEFSHTSLRDTDLRSSHLAGIRLRPIDLQGAIVAPEQALDLLPLLGVEIRTAGTEQNVITTKTDKRDQ